MNRLLHAFNFEGQEIRMFGTPDDPEWVAIDVCSVLGIKNHRDLLSRMPDNEKGCVGLADSMGRVRETLTLKEPGLFRAIFGSRKTEAERLKTAVFNEVLPSIRKTGYYSAKPMTPAQLALQQAQALVDIEAKQLEHEERLDRAARCLRDMGAKVDGVQELVSQRIGRSTIQDDEVTSKAIAELLGWYSHTGKLHATAISQIAKDRGFIRLGLARMADFYDDSAGWVHSTVFTTKGVRDFEIQLDRPFLGLDKFVIHLSSGKKMHIYRKPATTEAA